MNTKKITKELENSNFLAVNKGIKKRDTLFTIKKQFKTIKENWLIAILLIILVAVPLFSGTGLTSVTKGFGVPTYEMEEMAMRSDSFRGGGVYYDNGFAPEIEERKITKTAYLTSEVERGKFKEAETELKAILAASDSYLLNENVNRYGKGIESYYQGHYQIKVETSKYDFIVNQLKDIGEVQSFSENMRDITASYSNVQEELNAEKARLQRFQQMYNDATDISDKINLNDRIFDQERRVKYLEDALENKDLRIDYSTVSVTLKEEQSAYVNMAMVKFSQLVRKLVNSFNSVLGLLFWALPWALIAGIVWFVVRRVRRK